MQLGNLVREQRHTIINLTGQVDGLKKSLMQWEGCECARYCIVDDQRVSNGSMWKNGSKDCQCVSGKTVCTCRKLSCLPTQSEYAGPEDECLTCKNGCMVRGRSYSYMEKVMENNVECICRVSIHQFSYCKAHLG